MDGRILIGTASWADPGFVKDWYPKKLPAAQRLPYYAAHFPLVEVNSTFYGVPDRETVQSWAAHTPHDFVFDVKLHKLLSLHSTTTDLLPEGLRSKVKMKGKRVELTPDLQEEVTEIFLHSIEPLAEARKLGSLLLQMSPSFGPRDNSLDELNPLLGQLEGREVAVELRNRGWLDPQRMKETLGFFEEQRIAFVCVDAPESQNFMVMPPVDVVTTPKLAYFRLHGRNEQGYTRGRTVAERFDYDYSDKELQEHAGRAQHLASMAEKVHVIYNNNNGSLAPDAAARLLASLERRAVSKEAA